MVAVLAEARPFGDDALVRGRPQRVDLVEQPAQHRHPVLAWRRSAPKRTRSASIPGGGPGGGVHEHERVETVGMGEHHPARDHAAHRVTEQPEGVEPERVGHRQHVGGEAIQRVGGRLVGSAALPVTAKVERDDAVVTGERLHVVGEVLLGAAEAVYQEQRWGIVGGCG